MMFDPSRDAAYLRILTDRLAVCKSYKPRFGQSTDGLSLEAFSSLYGADAFYAWFGLDTPEVYAAHKTAGGITSVYRQLGVGSEKLIQRLIQDQCQLTLDQVNWAYTTSTASTVRTLKLDARIDIMDVADEARRNIIKAWMHDASRVLGVDDNIAAAMRGLVFEVRQGYKSKDSKRQNADGFNAAQAYTKGYLPVLLLLSSQIDADLLRRYTRDKWLVLRGYTHQDIFTSTYTFMRETIGFDLAAFFERHRETLRQTMRDVLTSLLSA